MKTLFYVVYEDERGEKDSVFFQGPNEDIVRKAMGPRVDVLHVVEITDPDFIAEALSNLRDQS